MRIIAVNCEKAPILAGFSFGGPDRQPEHHPLGVKRPLCPKLPERQLSSLRTRGAFSFPFFCESFRSNQRARSFRAKFCFGFTKNVSPCFSSSFLPGLPCSSWFEGKLRGNPTIVCVQCLTHTLSVCLRTAQVACPAATLEPFRCYKHRACSTVWLQQLSVCKRFQDPLMRNLSARRPRLTNSWLMNRGSSPPEVINPHKKGTPLFINQRFMNPSLSSSPASSLVHYLHVFSQGCLGLVGFRMQHSGFRDGPMLLAKPSPLLPCVGIGCNLRYRRAFFDSHPLGKCTSGGGGALMYENLLCTSWRRF